MKSGFGRDPIREFTFTASGCSSCKTFASKLRLCAIWFKFVVSPRNRSDASLKFRLICRSSSTVSGVAMVAPLSALRMSDLLVCPVSWTSCSKYAFSSSFIRIPTLWGLVRLGLAIAVSFLLHLLCSHVDSDCGTEAPGSSETHTVGV